MNVVLGSILVWLSIIFVEHFDSSYQTVRQSTHHSQRTAMPYASPDHQYFDLLYENHWRLSPFFSNLEDTFYPFHVWTTTPLTSVLNPLPGHPLPPHIFQQFESLKRVELSTKVRAKRAYFLAKRRNFKTTALNQAFEQKTKQWVSVVKERIDRQVDILTSSYNLIGTVAVICSGMFIVLLSTTNLNTAIIGVLGLLIASLIGSHSWVVSANIPFHWLVVGWGFLLKRQPIPHHPFMRFIAIICPIFAAASSEIGLGIGLFFMVFILKLPQFKAWFLWMLWLHPCGTWVMLTQKIKAKHLFASFATALAVVTIGHWLGIRFLLTAPIHYLGPLGIAFNSVVLLIFSAFVISNKSNPSPGSPQEIAFGWPLAIIGVALAKFLTQSPLFEWSFFLVLNPSIQWAAVLALCMGPFKPRSKAPLNVNPISETKKAAPIIVE
jgi:hypothetical protein